MRKTHNKNYKMISLTKKFLYRRKWKVGNGNFYYWIVGGPLKNKARAKTALFYQIISITILADFGRGRWPDLLQILSVRNEELMGFMPK